MQEIETLVKMANQIAQNFAFHDDAVNRTADHLKRFWAPSMRDRLLEYVADGGEGVSAEVKQSLERLGSGG